jgi:hypothetical protein
LFIGDQPVVWLYVFNARAKSASGRPDVDDVLRTKYVAFWFHLPFLGMPKWAQVISECLALTHFMRIARSIMLKGSTLSELRYDALALAILMAVAMIIAVTRFPAHGTRLRDRLGSAIVQVRIALQDGASIAGLLIATEAMVAEKPKKETPMPAVPPGGGMDY